MTYANSDALVEPGWLAARLGDRAVAILDATWYLPPTDRDAKADHAAAHIPGAIYFDIDDVVDPRSTLPHTLPPPDLFADKVSALGVGNDTHVVVYDAFGAFSAPRVWWMFRVMGHETVSVLNGGLAKWRSLEHELDDTAVQPVRARFEARLDDNLVAKIKPLARDIADNRIQVLDARSPGRFFGRDPEPRPGLAPGHMPGALNLPYGQLLHEDGTFKDGEALQAAFANAGIDPEQPVVTSCGSGVSACILSLGLYLLGRTDWAVYDGSWAEWGSTQDAPVEI